MSNEEFFIKKTVEAIAKGDFVLRYEPVGCIYVDLGANVEVFLWVDDESSWEVNVWRTDGVKGSFSFPTTKEQRSSLQKSFQVAMGIKTKAENQKAKLMERKEMGIFRKLLNNVARKEPGQ